MNVTTEEAGQEIARQVATLRHMLVRENDPERASALGSGIIALQAMAYVLDQTYLQVTMDLAKKIRIAQLTEEQLLKKGSEG